MCGSTIYGLTALSTLTKLDIIQCPFEAMKSSPIIPIHTEASIVYKLTTEERCCALPTLPPHQEPAFLPSTHSLCPLHHQIRSGSRHLESGSHLWLGACWFALFCVYSLQLLPLNPPDHLTSWLIYPSKSIIPSLKASLFLQMYIIITIRKYHQLPS